MPQVVVATKVVIKEVVGAIVGERDWRRPVPLTATLNRNAVIPKADEAAVVNGVSIFPFFDFITRLSRWPCTGTTDVDPRSTVED